MGLYEGKSLSLFLFSDGSQGPKASPGIKLVLHKRVLN